MIKKKWEVPKLIVISRGKPEEAVLLGCKGGDLGSPNNINANCERWATVDCLLCSPIMSS